jgi:hypothetical protein
MSCLKNGKSQMCQLCSAIKSMFSMHFKRGAKQLLLEMKIENSKLTRTSQNLSDLIRKLFKHLIKLLSFLNKMKQLHVLSNRDIFQNFLARKPPKFKA